MSEAVSEEDLIESTAHPRAAWRLRAERIVKRPAAVAVLLVSGLIVGSVTGYFVGHNDRRVVAGISPDSLGLEQVAEGLIFTGQPVDQIPGPTPIPTLTPEDVSALGENVTRQITVLIGRSTIPVLCGTSLQQPGTSYGVDLGYSSTAFQVDGGRITQLVWPRPGEAAASGTLQTLAFQAQQCPDVPEVEATITTSGVQTGIGDEYAVFHRRPTRAGPDVVDATVVLVRVGPGLIEMSFTSDVIDRPDAEGRSLRAAAAAAEVATGA
ncbi:hypothetical protein BH24ACT9_BH24ACT9_13520 [soil metagenome]